MSRCGLICAIVLVLPVAATASPIAGSSVAPAGRRSASDTAMVFVAEGPFLNGYDRRMPDEGPARTRWVPAFWIDRYEVTNERYAQFVETMGMPPPRPWRGGGMPAGRAQHPVVYVSWYEATAYCHWAGARLPTGVEWEKAARGTDGRLFPWGNMFDPRRANTPHTGVGDTTPVGSFPAGQSPYGLFDMAGNVYEWTAWWYRAYPGSRRPSENYGERFRVLRGGSHVDCSFYRCGLSAPTFNRAFFLPETRNRGFGMRCARSVE